MNANRDIDRVLDAWFVDGPSVMPDRLFDAVLDQVERVPQRRLAHLSARFAEMNPRIRLFTVLAAALVVVVAAIAVIGGGSRGPSNSTVAPTVGASATPGPAVRSGQLAGKWMGAPSGLAGVDADGGTVLAFVAPDRFSLAPAEGDNLLRVRSSVAATADGQITLTSLAADRDCPEGTVGRYAWTLSASGQALTITTVAEQCPARSATAGTWERMDCPTANDNCFGNIDPGTYSSQYFDPFVAHGGAWTHRYGVLRYTVPAGWSNVEDWPEYFGIGPTGVAGSPQIYFASDVFAVPDDDMCADRPSTTVGRSAEEIATWIDGLAGVSPTSKLRQETVGGLPAWQLDVKIATGWTARCPWNDTAIPDRTLFTDGTPGNDGFSWGIPAASSMRLWLVDLGDGRALMIDFESETQASFDASVAAATSVVQSLIFTR